MLMAHQGVMQPAYTIALYDVKCDRVLAAYCMRDIAFLIKFINSLYIIMHLQAMQTYAGLVFAVQRR